MTLCTPSLIGSHDRAGLPTGRCRTLPRVAKIVWAVSATTGRLPRIPTITAATGRSNPHPSKTATAVAPARSPDVVAARWRPPGLPNCQRPRRPSNNSITDTDTPVEQPLHPVWLWQATLGPRKGVSSYARGVLIHSRLRCNWCGSRATAIRRSARSVTNRRNRTRVRGSARNGGIRALSENTHLGRIGCAAWSFGLACIWWRRTFGLSRPITQEVHARRTSPNREPP